MAKTSGLDVLEATEQEVTEVSVPETPVAGEPCGGCSCAAPAPIIDDTITLGDTVFYVLPKGPNADATRAAVVTGVNADGSYNLCVLLDAKGDDPTASDGLFVPTLRVEGATQGAGRGQIL